MVLIGTIAAANALSICSTEEQMLKSQIWLSSVLSCVIAQLKTPILALG